MLSRSPARYVRTQRLHR